MIKRFLSIFFAICLVLTLLPVTALADFSNATPTNAAVFINGRKVSFESYSINGSNYFKLRDLAMAFDTTNKKFNIGYNSATNTVEITVGQSYVPVGGELKQGDGSPKAAEPGSAAFRWVEASGSGASKTNYNIALGTYVIGGNNFVKLRDLMQWLDVGVGYDSKTAAISIATGQSYVLPKYFGNPLAEAEAIDSKYRGDYGAQPGSIQNSGELVYQDGWYYHYGYRIQDGGEAVPYVSDYGDYIADNWQVYGDKVFFEGALSASVVEQVIFSMNLDGSGVTRIVTDAMENGQRFTIYKGKLYANTYGHNGMGTSIVSYNLDGTERKILYTGDLSVIRDYVGYGHRAYHIFDDRIYYMTKDGIIYSMNLDGGDTKSVASPGNSALKIISVYDGYVYYETMSTGLHRVKIDGTCDMCVLPARAEQYAIYGDKIVYNVDHTMLGVVNTDGTGRYQFPNAKQDPGRTTKSYVSNLMVLNSRYTFAQNVIFNNDSAVPGHVRLVADYSDPNDNDIRGQRGWFPTTVPYVNTLTDIISSGTPADKLSDGWYNLRCMNNYLYLDADSGAQLRKTDKKQKFKVEYKNGNYFTIKTEKGKYLGISETMKNGVQVRAVDEEYLWAFRSENNSDIFSMRPANNGNMILNAAGEQNSDGTWIILWQYDKEDAPNHAEFRFIPVK